MAERTTYNNPVVLDSNTTVTSNGGGNIDFESTVNAGSGGPVTLTVATSGQHIFCQGTGSGVTVVNQS